MSANYKETELTNVRVGQPAELRVDTYPDQVIEAVVASISPATGAEFALLPPQNAFCGGNRANSAPVAGEMDATTASIT